MPKKFSESIAVPDELRYNELGQRLHIIRVQAQHGKNQPEKLVQTLAILDESIAKLDETIEMPKMRKIRLNSRLYDDFPVESADRREMIRLKTNKDIDVELKWLGILEQKLQPYQGQLDAAVSLVYLD